MEFLRLHCRKCIMCIHLSLFCDEMDTALEKQVQEIARFLIEALAKVCC